MPNFIQVHLAVRQLRQQTGLITQTFIFMIWVWLVIDYDKDNLLTRHWNKLTGLSSQVSPASVAASSSALPLLAFARTGKKSSRCSSLNSPNHCRRYRIWASDVNPGADILLVSGRWSPAKKIGFKKVGNATTSICNILEMLKTYWQLAGQYNYNKTIQFSNFPI